tara:strand:- start:177 stop:566 length:390 start_codon:yes stop_codon:yes gene_type:complete
MAVQRITHKKIIKYDTSNPNFKNTPKPEVEVDGNIQEDTDIYGEKKHTYQPDNGNLQMNEMMTGIMNKLDNLGNINNDKLKPGRAIEVDIKREIAIGKLDTNEIKSEEYVGKVKTKKDKLKALRIRNGR